MPARSNGGTVVGEGDVGLAVVRNGAENAADCCWWL